MHIAVLGINHNTAALETREKVAFTDRDRVEAYTALAGGSIGQGVILSTCNRTEFYTLAGEAGSGREELLTMLCSARNATRAELENCLYYYQGFEAVSHLFRVTSGLDSMILGETQILGQVRDSYEQAVQYGAVGKELHGLFQHAVRCAKKVQTETKINDNSLSVSHVAVEMIRRELGSFEGLKVLVIGAGKMSRLTLNHLHEAGAKDIWVTSRTYRRARDLADRFEGKTIDFSRKKETLPAIDIIISSTAAPHLILRREEMEKVMEQRSHRPVFIIDIAVPRDIDPAIGTIENVYLYDMDSLQEVVAGNRREREREASAARSMIAAEAEEFQAWFKTLAVAPVIGALRRKAEQIRRDHTARCTESKLCRLSEREKAAVENLTRSIVNSILKDPILRMKENAQGQEAEEHVHLMLYLFDLKREFETAAAGDRQQAAGG